MPGKNMKLYTFLRVEDDIVQMNQIIAKDKDEATALLTFIPNSYTEINVDDMSNRIKPDLLKTENEVTEI